MKRILFTLALLLLPSAVLAQVVDWGDFEDADQTEYVAFDTPHPTTAVMTSITGISNGATDAVVFYNLSSDTEITTADTINIDWDSRTGKHRVTIDFSAATFSDGNYIAVIVDADAVVGTFPLTNRTIATFSVGRYSTAAEFAEEVPTPAEIVDEWETQSQADPTGFHVNVKEVNGTAQTAGDVLAQLDAVLAALANTLQADTAYDVTTTNGVLSTTFVTP